MFGEVWTTLTNYCKTTFLTFSVWNSSWQEWIILMKACMVSWLILGLVSLIDPTIAANMPSFTCFSKNDPLSFMMLAMKPRAIKEASLTSTLSLLTFDMRLGRILGHSPLGTSIAQTADTFYITNKLHQPPLSLPSCPYNSAIEPKLP